MAFLYIPIDLCVEASENLSFRYNLGCAPYTRNWAFFQKFQNTSYLSLYYSDCKKSAAMDFIWGDKGYPAIRF